MNDAKKDSGLKSTSGVMKMSAQIKKEWKDE